MEMMRCRASRYLLLCMLSGIGTVGFGLYFAYTVMFDSSATLRALAAMTGFGLATLILRSTVNSALQAEGSEDRV